MSGSPSRPKSPRHATAEQAPAAQTPNAGQACPQAPQFASSLARLTQRLPQRTWPAGQVGTHVLCAQVAPGPHALPQPPQFAVSVATSTQRPAQSVPPAMAQVAAQTPAAQTWPVPQAAAQSPQFAGSFRRSAHPDAPQVASGAMHVSSVVVGVQAPAEQNWPAGQTLAQEPQCAGSFRRSTHAGASAPHVERGAAQVSTGVVGTGPEDEPQPENKAMAAAAASTDRVIGAELRQGMVESTMDVGARYTPLFIDSHGNGSTAKRSACVTRFVIRAA